MSRLLRLYPRRWRARYEAELRALLEEKQPTLSDRLDLLRGALIAWLNPRYGYALRRSALWLVLAAMIAVIVAPVIGSFQSTPAQASPRYPVTLGPGPDNELNTLQFVVYRVQRTIPHLVLLVDSHDSWLLTGVITERSPVNAPARVAHVPEIESSARRHAWDFGRIRPGQVVWLTMDITVLRPRAFVYSIHGYGALTADGKPDTKAPLSTPAAQTGGTISFGTVGPSQYPYWVPVKPGCGDAPRNGFHLCSLGDLGMDFLKFEFRNDSTPIPHFILQVDSRRSWTLAAVTASEWKESTPRLFVPRRLASRRFVYTLDFGRLPHGASLHIRLEVSVTGLSGFGDKTQAFARLTPSGKPDPMSLIFAGWDSLG